MILFSRKSIMRLAHEKAKFLASLPSNTKSYSELLSSQLKVVYQMRKEQLEEAASKGLTAVEDMQCGDQFLYGQLKLFRVIKFEKDHFVAHCKSNGSVETFGLDMAVRKSGSVGLSQLEGYFLQNGEVFCYEGEWYIVKEEFPAADGGMRVSKIGTRNEGYFDDNLVVEVYDSWAIR